MDATIFNAHDVVLLMTCYQCVLYASLLLVSPGRSRSRNCFLALFLLSQAAIPLDILINFGAEFRYVALNISPNLFYIFGFAYWLEGPLLLWYTKSVLYQQYRPPRREYLYLVPLVLYIGYELVFYYSLSTPEKIELQLGYDLAQAPQYMNYVTLARELFRLAFSIACLRAIQTYRQTLQESFSNTEVIDFQWLKLLVVGFSVLRTIAVIVALLIIASLHFDLDVNFETVGLAGNYLTFLLISMLIFFSLKKSSVVAPVAQPEAQVEDQGKTQYSQHQVEQLLQYMEEHKPHLETSLTIDELARKTRIPAKELSAITNRHLNKNFFEFVNSYRIEEAKQRLQDPSRQHQSILTIMFDAGFNSKATFNTLFKKATGQTPTAFRKQSHPEPET